jgi:hypothetical protein
MSKPYLYLTICIVTLVFAGCSEDRFEPNDGSLSAVHVEAGVEAGLSAPAMDRDWFHIDVPHGQMATVNIAYSRLGGAGNSHLWAYEGDMEAFAYLWYPVTPGLFGEVEEYVSVLSLSGGADFFFEVTGDMGLGQGYDLSVELSPYMDGYDCAEVYDADDCIGSAEGETKLYQFPFADREDGFVGDGYMLQSCSKYSWARRETIMYVRAALHEVQVMFPGTNALGLIDMSQRDGLTPGQDVDRLRHPEQTHSQGGNIDVAYFQTGADNSARNVCDAEGGSHDGYFCDDSAVDTHIVDLERTAYFIAKLSCMPDGDNPRLRVVGVDRVIGPLLDETVLDLRDRGLISEEEAHNGYSRIAYGDGWPFHHHHMHVSFQWWDSEKGGVEMPAFGCGFRMAGDGEL